MEVTQYFYILAIGRLLIWAIQSQGLTTRVLGLFKRFTWLFEFLKALVACQFCIGFWVYLLLFFTPASVFYSGNFILSKIITATISSFVTMMITKGWISMFGYEVIE